MKKYEAMLVLKPADEVVEGTLEQVKNYISSHEGKLVDVDNWGKRFLAYPIDTYIDGYYILVHFLGDRALRVGLDNYLKLQENVLRHLVVKSIS